MRHKYLKYEIQRVLKRTQTKTNLAISGLIFGLAGLGMAVALPLIAHAESIGPITFESPTYTVGSINGQDGWSALGSAGSGCATYDEGVVSNTYGYSSFGGQTFRLSDAVTSGCFGDQAFAKPLVNSVGETASTAGTFSAGTKQTHFEMQFDIASTAPGAQQSGMHMSVSPDRGDGSRMSYLRFEDGSAGLDIFFDDVQGTTNPASFVETQIASGLNRAVPHNVKLTMDALDGPSNDVVKVWIDGTLKITGTSWENYYRFDSEASAEQSPRIVKTVEFRESGTATPGDAGKGFLVDNLSLSSGPSALPYPTSKDQCKHDGWKNFTDPSFKNQGQCIDWVEAQAHGDLRMSGPSQRIEFNVANTNKHGGDRDKGDHDKSNKDNNTVEYWNFDYPGGVLHYKADVACAYVNPQTNESRFMFQIPAGHPGLSGLYVVAYVKEVKHGADLYGHSATADLATATQWCQTGVGFSPTMYPVTKGSVEVN